MSEAIPAFEGRPVDSSVVKMSGAAPLEEELSQVVLGVDDLVQMTAMYRVVGVNHQVDKDGKLIRVQTLRPVEMHLTPFDVHDPNDIGVMKALPLPVASSSTDVEDEDEGVDDYDQGGDDA